MKILKSFKKLLYNITEYFAILFIIAGFIFMATSSINFLFPFANLHIFVNSSMFTCFASMCIAILAAYFSVVINKIIQRRDKNE